MLFNVEMWSFGGLGKVRPVNVPDCEATGEIGEILEGVFKYGQNMFQNVPDCHSVSVGDVARIPHIGGLQLWLVLGQGWHKFLSHIEYHKYIVLFFSKTKSK
jgi:hypothetical protein